MEAKITITEALAEIKTIGKRLDTKRQSVIMYLWRPHDLVDPLKEGGSTEFIRKERQAITDLEERIVNIRAAIAASNETTQITIGGITRTVTSWLAWKKDVAPGVQMFLIQIRNAIEQARIQQNARGGGNQFRGMGMNIQANAGNADKPADITVNLNETELAKESEKIEEITGQLDGQLSLKNATTFIKV